ncbi:MAG: FtsW/RodA/SpoVE family cell cycle protein [Bacteroides sp.]|nr:FtsW/RodA/SpoVE family cell cycle protein [Roseburia sp.]MCM1346523.1 FtsW/RodA/SpoVE family cell cycle protein [Bacteroides sp.]MCM1420103.1 FtsW/RodA/SpoVE family cell cycle protein [Bacteroides sp.]
MGKFVSDFFQGKLFKGDKGVWMIYFFLCLISLVEVYSASSTLTYKTGQHWTPMISQAGFMFAGLVVILMIHRIPCKWFMLFPFVLLPVSVFLLLYTLFFGGEINETSRWITLGPIRFQPSELGKAALIMSVAVVLAKTQAEETVMVKGTQKKVVGAIKGGRSLAFRIIVVMTLVVCGLIFPENFSTSVMLATVVFVMMIIGHIPWSLIVKTIVAFMALGMVAATMVVTLDKDTLNALPGCKRLATVKGRMERRFENQKEQTNDSVDLAKYIKDENAQVTHACMAVANSNIIGRGAGNSIERDFLSHAESDFIFSIIVEEIGLFGALFVIFLYIALLIRVGRIAQKCQRFFPAFLVLGFGIMMVLQAVVNMGVAVGLFPVTGQPLPLISRGGTSIIITSFYIGVILSVSRYAEKVNEKATVKVENIDRGETTEYYDDKNMI